MQQVSYKWIVHRQEAGDRRVAGGLPVKLVSFAACLQPRLPVVAGGLSDRRPARLSAAPHSTRRSGPRGEVTVTSVR
jgi:hypothetical protein